jgi:putative selenium metabolism hydrolase
LKVTIPQELGRVDAPSLIETAQSFIRLHSLSGQEGPMAQRVTEVMSALAFDRVWTDEGGSVIGVIDGGQPGPTLLLDAHIDTVGITPGSEWPHDPFAGDIADGFIYGRGTADMKGALAAMLHAAGAADRAHLKGRVAVCASVMEEVMEGYGLRGAMQELQPDFVIIGEATDLNLNRGGRGRAEIHIETRGIPAHSSSPEVGHNAVYDMVAVIAAIQGLQFPTHPLLGPALIALTDIVSEPYPGHSVIPSRCRATFDRRLLPGETAAGVLHQISGLPALKGLDLSVEIPSGEYRTYTGKTLRGEKFFPAWELDERHELVIKAAAGLRATGLDPQLGAYRFCTNAAYSAGTAGVPTVGFGPGREQDAHVIGERLPVSALERAARGYRGMIEAILGSG